MESRKKSVIWNYFKKNGEEAECLLCKTILKIGKYGSTGTLINHLRRHPKEFNEFSDRKKSQTKVDKKTTDKDQPAISELFKKKETFTTTHPRHMEITKAVAQMIAVDLHSYSLVEEKSFKHLLNVLEPRYNVPSRTSFSRNIIPELYSTERRKIKSILEHELPNVPSVSLTTDSWTSRANDSFISLTLHYLTTQFEYRTYVLGNRHIKESHTADFLLGQLEEMVGNWELPRIQIFAISDNGANIKAALDRSSWDRIPCFAHCLQLAIHDAESDVSGVNEMCKRARSIVGHYNHSSSARARLKELQKKLSLPDLELLQDVATRWNSRYDMLHRLIQLKEAVSADIAACADIDNLTSAQWKLAKGVVEVLKPFKQVTTELSSETYPTISMVAPALHVIEESLTEFIKKGEFGSGLTLARSLLKSLKSRFPVYKQDPIYINSMALDPRYKLKILTPTETNLALTMIRPAIEKLKKQQSIPVNPVGQEPSDLSQPGTSTSDTQKSLWSTFDVSDEEEEGNGDPVEKELEFYLQKKRISTKENPLQWWKENAELFPNLRRVAQFYLGIPATQTSSERLFSTSGLIVTSKREQLLPQHIEELCFLHGNLKLGL